MVLEQTGLERQCDTQSDRVSDLKLTENNKKALKNLLFSTRYCITFWYNQLVFWMLNGAISIHRVKENKYKISQGCSFWV